jgi:hypothetical protein
VNFFIGAANVACVENSFISMSPYFPRDFCPHSTAGRCARAENSSLLIEFSDPEDERHRHTTQPNTSRAQ